ncbi:MAG: DNA mismatch repair endonuclease MutL [Prevotella sp.]|jgi:DNA mismatch repair protein MutL|nr:DNA mismatch repair endonuclease MutL [Prevotella sp.]MDY0153174.1 DNA mismatch repair endonuclease MutL [Prevotella sp.]
MSDIIQLLPDSVANQIAAGEVIQRPASVIKELVENAVDAGAKNINVLVVDAGRTSIQVIDDGKGMSETDARLSFERHATSKIRSAEDLFSLHTMGFRGEALASIAAVAQIELKTRQASDEIGTLLSISGSKFTGQEPCSCPVGSNFSIENLFYNVPARRKFLKSNSTELNNIITAFERIALVYPEISFTLHSNGTEMFNLKAGVLRQRIIDIFGKRLNQDLLSVNVDTSMCKISGYVGKPESARKKGAHQYFFVNGRYMKHPYFSKAVINAFDRLVPMGEQVPYFIYFDINAEDIDVNIHPTKTEIKFENEQAIWQILSASVKESVGMFNDVPSIDFDTQGRPDIPVYNPENNVAAPKVQFNPTYNPFNTGSSSQPSTKSVDKWENLYNGLKSQRSQETELFTSKMTQPSTDIDESPVENVIAEKSPAHYQYKGCYIMTAVKSGLMIVDQHRAHVRILYDKYLEQMKDREVPSQKVLFPETIHLSATEDITLNKIEPEMVKLGFEITALGGASYAINAIPAGIEGLNVVELVHDIIVSAQEKTGDITQETNSALALTLARNAAIPFGQVLSNDEMENIFNSLFASSNPNYTPDGKNILCILKQSEIEHLLG